MSRNIFCIKLKKEGKALDFQPLPGTLGKRIFDNVSKEAWENWLKQQTILINENRLNMSDPQARYFLQKEIEKYFFEK